MVDASANGAIARPILLVSQSNTFKSVQQLWCSADQRDVGLPPLNGFRRSVGEALLAAADNGHDTVGTVDELMAIGTPRAWRVLRFFVHMCLVM